jgi:hypothetical protein
MEFLFPDGVMVPERGLPPLTMRSDIGRGEGGGRKVDEGEGRGGNRAKNPPSLKLWRTRYTRERRPRRADAFEMRGVRRALARN